MMATASMARGALGFDDNVERLREIQIEHHDHAEHDRGVDHIPTCSSSRDWRLSVQETVSRSFSLAGGVVLLLKTGVIRAILLRRVPLWFNNDREVLADPVCRAGRASSDRARHCRRVGVLVLISQLTRVANGDGQSQDDSRMDRHRSKLRYAWPS
jgi:hypothetical protein